MYEVEKNIPLPFIFRIEKRKYPFEEMEVGDSFFITLKEKDLRKRQISISSAGKHLGPKKFITRKCDGGIRCWRIE